MIVDLSQSDRPIYPNYWDNYSLGWVTRPELTYGIRFVIQVVERILPYSLPTHYLKVHVTPPVASIFPLFYMR